jgi:hypothetical protein
LYRLGEKRRLVVAVRAPAAADREQHHLAANCGSLFDDDLAGKIRKRELESGASDP